MKPEFLDALLADRTLGELSPEVAALLEAWLAQNPAAAARAAELDATLRLARATVAGPRETPAPLDLARLRRESSVLRFRAGGAELLRLAAGIALGAGLGWTLHRPPAPADTAPAPIVRDTVPRTPAATATTDFWSVTRFAPDSIPTAPRKSL